MKIVPIIKPNEAQLLNVSIVKNILIIAITNTNRLESRKPKMKQNKQVFGQQMNKIEEL
jgi:hypothetical protein